jgi:hypothetical protein
MDYNLDEIVVFKDDNDVETQYIVVSVDVDGNTKSVVLEKVL